MFFCWNYEKRLGILLRSKVLFLSFFYYKKFSKQRNWVTQKTLGLSINDLAIIFSHCPCFESEKSVFKEILKNIIKGHMLKCIVTAWGFSRKTLKNTFPSFLDHLTFQFQWIIFSNVTSSNLTKILEKGGILMTSHNLLMFQFSDQISRNKNFVFHLRYFLCKI